MNSILTKILAVLLSLLLLTYIGYQMFLTFYNPYETEIVKQETYIQDVDLNGFFVRNEKPLQQKKQGVISYRFDNAEKISKSTAVANIYHQESDVYNLNKVLSLRKEKEIIKQSQDRHNIEGLKIDALNKKINASQDELIANVNDGNLLEIDRIYNDLLLDMNKVQISLDKTLDYNSAIADIDSQIAALDAQISKDNVTVISEQSGYFSNSADGYEEIFTPKMLENLSVKQVKTYIDNEKNIQNDSIGKVQYDSQWDFVSVIKTSDLELFDLGDNVLLKFSAKTPKDVNATVSQIIKTEEKDGDESVIVFESNVLDPDLATMRFEKPKAIINNYTGIVIPKEAVRFEKMTHTVIDKETQEASEIEENVKGVYTLLGKTVRFKEIEIIYEDKYFLVSNINNNPNFVSVYDKVIIKGKDLNESS